MSNNRSESKNWNDGPNPKTIFGRSVNPLPVMGGQILPTRYYILAPSIFFYIQTFLQTYLRMSLFNFFSVAIDNWTRFPLIDPQTDLECGRHIGVLPEVIVPGTSEMALFEKGVIVNIYLVRDIKPPNHEFCFSHFFPRIFFSLTKWKRKQTFH